MENGQRDPKLFDLDIAPSSVTNNQDIETMMNNSNDLVQQNAKNIQRLIWIVVIGFVILLAAGFALYTKWMLQHGRNRERQHREYENRLKLKDVSEC